MIPIRLVMSAFGSYAGEEVIDFTKAGTGVFLITGDTGAGKTTIFDAVTYALYDQTSGGRRNGNMMRSQYAGLQTRTYVEFEFAYQGQHYRIVRSPEYERESKRKGKNGEKKTTTEKASVSLFLPDGSEFMGKKAETDKKIVEIIGLDAGQFTQTCMIAQGEFLRLLHARSDERKEIFSKIFSTGPYAQVQKSLREKTKEMYGQIKDMEKAEEQELAHLQEDQVNMLRTEAILPEQRLSLLKEWIAEEETEERICAERQKEIQGNIEDIRREIATVKEVNQKVLRWREMLQKREELKSREKDCRALEERTKLAELAQKVHLVEQTYLEKVQKNRETALELQKLEEQLAVYEKSRTKTAEQKESIRQSIAANRERRKIIEHSLQQLEEQLKEKEQCKITLLECENRQKEAEERKQELEGLLQKLPILEQKNQKQRNYYQELQKAQNRYEEAGNRYHAMNEAFLNEQAGILAEELKSGTPCPVCGSLTHPSPAVLSDGAPTQEEVKQCRQLREEAEKERDKRQQSFLEVRQEYRAYEQVFFTEGQRLLKIEFPKDVTEGAQLLDRERECSMELCRQREMQTKMARESLRKMEELEQEQRRQKLEQNRCDEEWTSQQEMLEKLESQVLLLEQKDSQAKGAKKVREQEYETGKKETEQALEEFQNAWKTAGFAKEDAYRKAMMPESRIQENKDRITAYQETCIRMEAAVHTWQQEMEGKELADVTGLQETCAEWEKQRTRTEQELKELYSKKETLCKVQEHLQKIYETNGKLRKSYALLGNLERTANGGLNGSAKIDFESYVQRQYFRQIITYANRRLKEMAPGQFLLRCRPLDQLGTRGNAGLDLDIYSVVTGKLRDVKTLSGGESFMAALSMALGMADVIAGTAGGIQMKTMFVDEGFGSLDEYSRGQAIRVLSELAGKERMIGIISHVTELKESMDCQLVVTKGKHGSHAGWSF